MEEDRGELLSNLSIRLCKLKIAENILFNNNMFSAIFLIYLDIF